jgi:hypothetical protein
MWGNDSIASCILYLSIDRGKLSLTCPDCFMSEERAPLVLLIRIWMGCRAGLDAVEKIVSLLCCGLNSDSFVIRAIA